MNEAKKYGFLEEAIVDAYWKELSLWVFLTPQSAR